MDRSRAIGASSSKPPPAATASKAASSTSTLPKPPAARASSTASSTSTQKAATSSVAAASPSTSRISDRFSAKTIDPFKTVTKFKTPFSAAYSRNEIPCRLVTGSVKHKLQWPVAPESYPFDPLLLLMAEGVRETDHPYAFVARCGFHDMVTAPGAAKFVVPLTSRIVTPLRMALMSSDAGVFPAAMDALKDLSDVVGPELNSHIKLMLSQLSKFMSSKTYGEQVRDLLQTFEANGGAEVVPIIKSKIPTYG